MTPNVQLQISNVSGFVTDLVCFKYVFVYVCLLGIGKCFLLPHIEIYMNINVHINVRSDTFI